MKKISAALITTALLFSTIGPIQVHASAPKVYKGPSILINGQKVEFKEFPVIAGGRTLVPVRGIFEQLGANVEWDSSSSSVKVEGRNTTVDMRIGYSSASVNNKITKLDVPPMIVNGNTMVPLRFVAETLRSDVVWIPDKGTVNIVNIGNSTSASRGASDRNFKVVIDAGHGGLEKGASYGGVYEKSLNLDIAKRLDDLLKAAGIVTYMTRTGDSTVGLYERSGLANRVGADLLVSVHNNAGSSAATGTMTLYYPGTANSNGNLSSKELSAIVQRELTGGLNSRSIGVISRPNLAVLRTANMPAVIAEVGYMSNQNELNKLKSAEYKQKAAESLKNAILKALKEI